MQWAQEHFLVRFWNFAPRTWGFPREPEKPVFQVSIDSIGKYDFGSVALYAPRVLQVAISLCY